MKKAAQGGKRGALPSPECVNDAHADHGHIGEKHGPGRGLPEQDTPGQNHQGDGEMPVFRYDLGHFKAVFRDTVSVQPIPCWRVWTATAKERLR